MQPLSITLIQTPLHWHDAAANRALFDDWFEQVPQSSQLVVLPEMFGSGFTMESGSVAESMAGPTVHWLKEKSREMDKTLCGSLVIEENGDFFNRFLWVQPDGGLATYDKRHLFRMADEQKHYQSGGKHILVELGEWRVCPLICYDLRFPVWFRNRGNYELLLCVANWPGARQVAWNALLKARAIENLCYAVGVNRVGTDGNGVSYRGGTSAYDYEGGVLLEVYDDPCLHTVTFDGEALNQYRKTFPAWRDADQFDLIL